MFLFSAILNAGFSEKRWNPNVPSVSEHRILTNKRWSPNSCSATPSVAQFYQYALKGADERSFSTCGCVHNNNSSVAFYVLHSSLRQTSINCSILYEPR